MKTVTKEYILENFSESPCVVTYKDGKQVSYKDLRHVNWKQAHKIRLDTPPKVVYSEKVRERVTRSGVAYLIK